MRSRRVWTTVLAIPVWVLVLAAALNDENNADDSAGSWVLGGVLGYLIIWGLMYLLVGAVQDGARQGRHVKRDGAPGAPVRLPIPERVRHEVWRRDQGRCVDCGSRERLEFDHIIPVSRGGSNTVRNIELRCELCNRRKGASV